MTNFIQVQWTSDDLVEIHSIVQQLLEKHLIVCANIIANVDSIYIWEGKIEQTSEHKVYLKTLAKHFEEIRRYIAENVKYEIPEILATPIVAGNQAYLNWAQQNLKP